LYPLYPISLSKQANRDILGNVAIYSYYTLFDLTYLPLFSKVRVHVHK